MKDSTFEKYCLVVDEWFNNGFNQRQAYKKYYPKASEETADVEMNRILSIPKIESYVKEKQKAAQDALRVSHEGLLEELRNWAYSDITETLLLSPEDVKELPDYIRRLITKYETTTKTYQQGKTPITETTIKLWFVSKERAMEMIHKHTGFYEMDNRQKNSLTKEDRAAMIERLTEKLK